MSGTTKLQSVVARRSELMAELFLQELKPEFVARADSSDLAIDFFVGFNNPRGGLNVVAVEVKATEQPVKGNFRISRKALAILGLSNIPGLLLVVDVKHNRYYFAEITPESVVNEQDMVSIPVTPVDDLTRTDLAARLSA